MTITRALIIDDEPDILELLEMTLSRMEIESDSAANVAEAKARLAQGSYNLCLTDMRLPDGNGIEIVQHIQQNFPALPVAVITAHGSMDTAIDALKAGAFDFVNKPIDLKGLRNLVSKAVTSSQLPQAKEVDLGIIGKSKPVLVLKGAIKKLARSQASVYIHGESGSGKELVARSIHKLGPREAFPFVPVNCGAIPTELMESEFFGHKKGSFTGATQDKQGLFQAAEGGTLFLDEVADLPLDMQVKLLRAIQEKAVRPIGQQNEIKTDVRVLCASHKNLEDLVNEGDFRQDLFYRLNVIKLEVPPLRERHQDIPLHVDNILMRISQFHSMEMPRIAKEALDELIAYRYPGNIRELENILERAFTLCEENIIRKEDLQLGESTTAAAGGSSSGKASHYQASQNYPSIDDYLLEVEKEILCGTLEDTRWNKTLAAKKLGISFRSLRYRLQKLNLDSDE